MNCLIINNEEFENADARIGSKNDSDRLVRLFAKLLRYNLFGEKAFENLSKSDMLQTVRNFRNDCCKKKSDTNGDVNDDHYDALILVIMSHGSDGSFTTRKNEEDIFVKIKIITVYDF